MESGGLAVEDGARDEGRRIKPLVGPPRRVLMGMAGRGEDMVAQA